MKNLLQSEKDDAVVTLLQSLTVPVVTEKENKNQKVYTYPVFNWRQHEKYMYGFIFNDGERSYTNINNNLKLFLKRKRGWYLIDLQDGFIYYDTNFDPKIIGEVMRVINFVIRYRHNIKKGLMQVRQYV